MSDYTLTAATLGIILSENLQGKYKVRIENLEELIRTVSISASPEAKQAYDKMLYQVILEIDDSDKDSEGPLRREVVYNFPDEYVRADEIRLDQQPAVAVFRLVAPAAEQEK